MKRILFTCSALILSLAHAEVAVKDAWVRATVAHQQTTGAYMQLTSTVNAKLVGAKSSVAGMVEVHSMTMEGDVMKMRAVPALELPAGKTVELNPSGYHVMLMDLKKQVKEGDTVPLTLDIQNQDGKKESVELKIPVRAMNSSAAMDMHEHAGHDGMQH